ncbi:MAG: hypothetical protein FJY10_01950 [Bacteroidetes bacterium]|nr:hypothetical protein [Bacteroidota bacterium]
MKKTIISLALVCVAWTTTYAQSSTDALRYSRLFYRGTARFTGVGGAFGSLGADFSVLSTNPGGIGLYKSSEFSISPNLLFGSSNADYQGEINSDIRGNFNVGNVGFVFAIPTSGGNENGIRNIQFAIGYNAQNNFNNRIYIEGFNPTNSLLTSYINTLNAQPGITPDQAEYDNPFDIGLALRSDLIYYDSTLNRYTCDMPAGGVLQKKSILTYGSIHEVVLAAGGNLNDRLYFGISIGVPVLRYYEESRYDENDNAGNIAYLNRFRFDQYLSTKGTGINLKAGVIYRPADWFRVGAAIHTPTYFGNLQDDWNSSMLATYDSVLDPGLQKSPYGQYEYDLMTPWRAIGSLSFLIGQYGLISAEYEYVDYGRARFYADEKDVFSDINKEISNKYLSPVNFRAGTEWRIGKVFLRAGYAYYGSPYKNGANDGMRYAISGGIGFRNNHFFADLGYTYSHQRDDYYLYDPNLVNPATIDYFTNNAIATFGIKF